MDFAYDQVIRPHLSYRTSGGLPRGKPRNSDRWICLQLSGARCMDNGDVRAKMPENISYPKYLPALALTIYTRKFILDIIIATTYIQLLKLSTLCCFLRTKVPYLYLHCFTYCQLLTQLIIVFLSIILLLMLDVFVQFFNDFSYLSN